MSFEDLPRSSWIEMLLYVERLLDHPRYYDPKCLMRRGRKIYSQNDEDGIIEEIFKRIGTTNKVFLEIGVESGLECNSLWLLINGWTGAWIEGDPAFLEKVSRSHRQWVDNHRLRLGQGLINAENVNALITESGITTGEIDFMSLDIDSNDYWVWRAMDVVAPRVVCIEYNATWPPPASLTIKYHPDNVWQKTNHFGASLGALTKLGAAKGYSLVGCNLSGANAFFCPQRSLW